MKATEYMEAMVSRLALAPGGLLFAQLRFWDDEARERGSEIAVLDALTLEERSRFGRGPSDETHSLAVGGKKDDLVARVSTSLSERVLEEVAFAGGGAAQPPGGRPTDDME